MANIDESQIATLEWTDAISIGFKSIFCEAVTVCDRLFREQNWGLIRIIVMRALAVVDIEERILSIRGQRVLLDRDLADLYGVRVKAINQALRRNRERFPEGFAFQRIEKPKGHSY